MMCCSEIFWTFLVTTCLTALLATIRMCYKSKCSNVKCFCFELSRDTETEEKEMEFQAMHGRPDSTRDLNTINTQV